MLSTYVGTEQYMCPELINGEKGDQYKIDIWAVGILFYYLLYKKCPWSVNQLYES